MRGILALSLLIVLSITAGSLSAMAANSGGVVMIKNEAVGMPVKIVSIETAPGEWRDSGPEVFSREGTEDSSGNIDWGPEDSSHPDDYVATEAGIVIVGFQCDVPLKASNISLAVEFNESGKAARQGVENQIFAIAEEGVFSDGCTESSDKIMIYAPRDLESANRQLETGKNYYATFLLPKSPTDSTYGLNHVVLTTNYHGQRSTGGMWIYHNDVSGNADRGIVAQDGHVILKRYGDGWTFRVRPMPAE